MIPPSSEKSGSYSIFTSNSIPDSSENSDSNTEDLNGSTPSSPIYDPNLKDSSPPSSLNSIAVSIYILSSPFSEI